MSCLVACLAFLAPRITSVVLFVFTKFFHAGFHEKFLLWLVGVVFMPFTTLCYAWAVNARGGVHGVFVVVMILAVIADLSALEGGRRSRRG